MLFGAAFNDKVKLPLTFRFPFQDAPLELIEVYDLSPKFILNFSIPSRTINPGGSVQVCMKLSFVDFRCFLGVPENMFVIAWVPCSRKYLQRLWSFAIVFLSVVALSDNSMHPISCSLISLFFVATWQSPNSRLTSSATSKQPSMFFQTTEFTLLSLLHSPGALLRKPTR